MGRKALTSEHYYIAYRRTLRISPQAKHPLLLAQGPLASLCATRLPRHMSDTPNLSIRERT